MTLVKRLRLLTAVLGAAALCAVVANSVIGDVRTDKPAAQSPAHPEAAKLIDELAKTNFSGKATVAYKSGAETLFAWQVKPALAVAAARPRDLVVLVDTSASQAGTPLKQARAILSALIQASAPTDRLDIWTINIDNPEHTRSLTQGLQSPTDKSVGVAVAKLADTECGYGAVDLKAGLEAALKQFTQKPGRQQAMIYLGDGESTVGTRVTESVRVELGQKIADKDVQFFAVPVGMSLSAENLHGLSVLTGGTVVRAREDVDTGRTDFVTRLTAALNTPVLRPTRVTFGPNDVDLLPGKLPPLRADRTTLVLGKLKGESANLTCKIEGTVAGVPTTVELAERLPASQAGHYFLRPMYEQWKSAGHKDAPAMLPAERALAQASVQFQLYREEFLELGLRAIASDRLDHAQKLFEASVRIDPAYLEAKNGLDLVTRMRSGELSKEKIRERVQASEEAGRLLLAKQEPAVQPAQPPAGGGQPPPAGPSGIERAQAAKQIADQEATANTEALIRAATRLKATEPRSAYADLKRALDGIRGNDQLTDKVRARLVTDLENVMTDIAVQGAEIERQNARNAAIISRVRNNINNFERVDAREKQTKVRIDRFHELMNVAKYEQAYQEAQYMAQERVNAGLQVPPEVLATYRIGQSATNLRELKELKRLREDRYLMCMLQVDKSFVPYPDEPPVHFPPAAVWRELTAERKGKYSIMSLGADYPQGLRDKKKILEEESIKGFGDSSIKEMTLSALKDKLEREFPKLKFVIREDLFRLRNPDVEAYGQSRFRLDLKPNGMLVGNFLDVALLDLNASYIVRPDYIEITTIQQRLDDKVIGVFNVAELVIPLPNSINQSSLNQSLQIFGQVNQNLGNAQGQAQFAGFGGGGFNIGGGGGFNIGGGGIGGGGGGFQIGGGVGIGGGGGIGGGNQGIGGGNLGGGFGGSGLGNQGGVGQFGNLGGQFGLQGATQQNLLLQLIPQLVGRGEWDRNNLPGFMPGLGVRGGVGMMEDEGAVSGFQPHSLGYYNPAFSLVVRGTSRYHPVRSFKLVQPGAGLGAAAPRNGGGNKLADAGIGAAAAKAIVARVGHDPEKAWNEVFAQAVTDPALIVGAVDVLFEMKEYKHSAEALKANLRHGHLTGEWAHEALAIALQEAKARPSDTERAALSAVDLAPNDSKAYLKAARAEFDLANAEKAFDSIRAEKAVLLCKRAAEMEPNLPDAYADALVYADSGEGEVKTDSIQWAAVNLLRRDWNSDGVNYAAGTKMRVDRAVKKLEAAGKNDEARKLTSATFADKTRDLLIEVRWQGQADLDLTVAEPNGSVCSALQKVTSGGGVLKCDILEQKDGDRSERYTAAQAYSGKYSVTVKKVLGTAFGNSATIVVTKFPGTDKQEFSVHAVDLSNPKAIEISLEGGRRTELASVPQEEVSEDRMLTTASPKTFGPTGFYGGSGTSADSMLVHTGNAPSNPTASLPLNSRIGSEQKIEAVSKNAPEMRFTTKLSADRTKLEAATTVVFAGPALDIPLPKLRLLPGGEAK